MKAREIDLSDAMGVEDAMRRIAIVRFAEVLTLTPALRHGRSHELHDLRIACKRLRYALERFTPRVPSLLDATTRLSQIQDTLGSLHDRDVLLASLPENMNATRARIRVQRDEALARTRALLLDAFAAYGPFVGLMRFTGLGYGFGEGDGVAPV
jgi:CHAD domain-containing protein